MDFNAVMMTRGTITWILSSLHFGTFLSSLASVSNMSEQSRHNIFVPDDRQEQQDRIQQTDQASDTFFGDQLRQLDHSTLTMSAPEKPSGKPRVAAGILSDTTMPKTELPPQAIIESIEASTLHPQTRPMPKYAIAAAKKQLASTPASRLNSVARQIGLPASAAVGPDFSIYLQQQPIVDAPMILTATQVNQAIPRGGATINQIVANLPAQFHPANQKEWENFYDLLSSVSTNNDGLIFANRSPLALVSLGALGPGTSTQVPTPMPSQIISQLPSPIPPDPGFILQSHTMFGTPILGPPTGLKRPASMRLKDAEQDEQLSRLKKKKEALKERLAQSQARNEGLRKRREEEFRKKEEAEMAEIRELERQNAEADEEFVILQRDHEEQEIAELEAMNAAEDRQGDELAAILNGNDDWMKFPEPL